jgi:2-aminoadipate transaminase
MDARIERLHRRAAESQGTLSLAGGLPLASLFPSDALIGGGLVKGDEAQATALQYGWPEGSPKLRSWVAARLASRGVQVTADDVIITTGAQQALAIIVQVLDLEGAFIGVDAETYPGALELFRHRGAIPTRSRDAEAHYVVPGSSNPRGLGLSEGRRDELLRLSGPIIADEAYAELRYDGSCERPLLLDAPDRVFHVGTLSKTLSPGVRLGWLIAPQRFRRALLDAKRDADLQAPSLTQALVESFLDKFDFDEHLARARRAYSARMDALMSALRRFAPQLAYDEPQGGFTLFASLDEPLDELSVLELATRAGTSFDPGSMFRHDRDRLPFGMRLSPCNIEASDIELAVRRLASSIAVHRWQRGKGFQSAPRARVSKPLHAEEIG